MTKEEIRQRAAIAVLPECVRETHEVLSNGCKLTEETQAKQAAMMAVAYADELAEKLSNVSENGKECKPANFAKSSKDLQELTEFEKAFITSYGAYAEGFNTIMKWRDYAKLTSKQLLDIAYKQFMQENAIVTKQEFYKAVDMEIKRRCDAIDVNKMADEYYDALVKEAKMDERMAGHCRLGYYLGMKDIIKKLKTK